MVHAMGASAAGGELTPPLEEVRNVDLERTGPKRVTPPSEVKSGTAERQSMEDSPGSAPHGADPTSMVLLNVARARPFMSIFVRCAHDRFADCATPAERVDKMIEKHPKVFLWMLGGDVFVTALGVVFLAVFAGLTIFRVFFPGTAG